MTASDVWVLDTNTVIHYFKGHAQVVEALLGTPPAHVALPAVVAYELHVGVEKSANRPERQAQLDQLLRAVRVLPFGLPEARAAARIRADLERAGNGIGPLDTLIAATALAAGAVLVTGNTREFSRVAGLALADWTQGR